MNRGCRDMSGVISPLLTGAEKSDDTAIGDDGLRMLQSRFLTPFTPVYGCLKCIPKTATSAILRGLRRGVQAAKLAQQAVAALRDPT